jgi:ribosomal protein S18 acetylase RimI-like enzyme
MIALGMPGIHERVTIRRLKLREIPQVAELWHEMMDYHRSLDPRFELAIGSVETYQEYLRSTMENYDCAIFVADLDGRIVGYTIAMILSNPAVFVLGRYGFVSEMGVGRAWQRSGIGQRMWEHTRRWLKRRGISVMQLNVSPRNEKGYSFWKKMGCTEFLTIMWHDIPESVR